MKLKRVILNLTLSFSLGTAAVVGIGYFTAQVAQASGEIEFANTDPTAPWNNPSLKNNPNAPWNNPLKNLDGFAPWHDSSADRSSTNDYMQKHNISPEFYWR